MIKKIRETVISALVLGVIVFVLWKMKLITSADRIFTVYAVFLAFEVLEFLLSKLLKKLIIKKPLMIAVKSVILALFLVLVIIAI